MELWVVVKTTTVYDSDEIPDTWELIGVYDDEQKAIDTCIKREYGYGPVRLNETLPDETVKWEGFRYPLIEKEYEEAGAEYPA